MITTIIPYKPRNLGAAYNEAMEAAKTDWVLFLDHDCLILRPNWYDMCVQAIEIIGTYAGWISASTNRCWCDDQRQHIEGDNILDHIELSNKLYMAHGIRLYKESAPIKNLGDVFSGFFILTHKQAWKDVGGFEESYKTVSHRWNGKVINFTCNNFLGIDNDYCLKLRGKGYATMVMPGLYVYHLREIKKALVV